MICPWLRVQFPDSSSRRTHNPKDDRRAIRRSRIPSSPYGLFKCSRIRCNSLKTDYTALRGDTGPPEEGLRRRALADCNGPPRSKRAKGLADRKMNLSTVGQTYKYLGCMPVTLNGG
jgi:hypothetical protein